MLPQLDTIEALKYNGPFRLNKRTRELLLSPSIVPKEKRGLFQKALLCDDSFGFAVNEDDDLPFITDLLKEHPRIELLKLYIDDSISGEAMTQLIEAIQASKLFGIWITRNGSCRQLLTALSHNTALKNLTIVFSPNSDEREPITRLIQNPNLQSFSLIANLNDLIHSLEPILSNHKSIKELSLTPFGQQDGCLTVSNILRNNSSIQQLTMADEFEGFKIAAASMNNFCGALMINKTLQSLYISQLSTDAARILFETLSNDKCFISALKITRTEYTDDNIRTLNDSMKTNTRIKQLELDYVDPVKCQILSEGLMHNKSIESLTFRFAAFGINGTRTLCDLVMNNDSIKTLQLLESDVSIDDCKLIAEMLSKNNSLTQLQLYHNPFGDEGVISLFKALTINSTLRTLKIGHSMYQYGERGLTGVTEMLTRNKTLRHLEVAVDYESEVSINAICEGLKHNESLTRLDLIDCKSVYPYVRTSLLEKLTPVIQNNYVLDAVELSMSDDAYSHLLRRNRQLKSEIQYKVAILSHNIIRSLDAVNILPSEVWRTILSLVTYPSLELHSIVDKIFNSKNHSTYNKRKREESIAIEKNVEKKRRFD